MALKGYLASGFQKLIGASRIKGANDQWVGEPNKLTSTSGTVPVSSPSFVFGVNYFDWNPTVNVNLTNTTALFSSNPTSETIITIRNASNNRIIIDNNGSVAGSCVGFGQIGIRPGQSITYIYDVTAARWREIGRTAQYYYSTQTVSTSAITADSYRLQTISINASSAQTVTTITAAYTAQAGDIVNLVVTNATSTITLQQDTTDAVTNGLIMNGDYAMTKYSAISFEYNGTNWVELSRNMVGGY